MSKAGSKNGTPNKPKTINEHIVEIVCDSGEGAQKAGTLFATISAKMGNGIWTVEIIPAEIKPPARSREGASGNRIRVGSTNMTNAGDKANIVVALNEQVIYGRVAQDAYGPETTILLENVWATDPDVNIRESYTAALADFSARGFNVIELPIHEACSELMTDPRLGKNIFVLGILCYIYQRDVELAKQEIAQIFAKKGEKIITTNQKLLAAGVKFAEKHIPFIYTIPSMDIPDDLVVMNGNVAVGLGVMASGMDMVSMYPITPATSASHYLAGVFDQSGGFVHQAEDEIAAIGFAIGCSYAGKTACTITSGPGMALKTEFIGLAVMSEIPLVIVNVQRGGPSTGLPTKVEQGDLLNAIYGATGDAPKIVMAPATIEECFHSIITARQLAEAFRIPVIVLTDANLATGQAPFKRPNPTEEWLAPPIDQSDWHGGVPAYAWNEETGISQRPIPGQKGGEYVLTGLAHTPESHVAYNPQANQEGCDMRSRKLASLEQTMTPPIVNGKESGDLLIVGWGSTLGAIEEAVDRATAQGLSVSSLHLRYLSPMEVGLEEIFSKFKKVMTVEINYSDQAETTPNPRPAQLALLLRAHLMREIDFWSIVPGQPLGPGQIVEVIREELRIDSTPQKKKIKKAGAGK
ncbi:MAG: 2-oxoacid:acceptor oxidoreductase subunit alpha [Phycisphaerales bacterium]|jgi:2-oxoglutarate ferredoxin oxidoreductase subunit alpha|nr:2-oxoacid:acceptor oxidoreductase subunit alpha [Phycisphaerales bacterium]MDP6692767.1 2-oxoacid:acceptor oxidoreductase subunit alpha [Phycisphaerales bacterium]